MSPGSFDPIQISSATWLRESTLELLRARDAQALFRLARSHGISQMRLAGAIGMSQGRISEVMSGKHQIQSMDVWTRIADGMHMPSGARAALGLASDASSDSTSNLIIPETGTSGLAKLVEADLSAGTSDLFTWSPEVASTVVAEQLAGGSSRSIGRVRANSEMELTTKAVEDATVLFSSMDYRYGGGFGRASLVQFVRSELMPTLDTDENHSPEYFSAASALLRLTGWKAYDVGLHGKAQGYFMQALDLAERAQNRMLAGRILGCMSHQANFIGNRPIAVQLARTAQMKARGHATPTAMAAFHAMEARGLAGLGEQRDCEHALGEAETWLNKGNPGNDPPWLQYFDEAELHAEMAHSYRDLGVADRAIRHATLAVGEHTDLYARSMAFCQMVEAVGWLDRGDVERAMSLTEDVAGRIGVLRSQRVVSYVDDFLDRISATRTKNVTEFNQRVRSTLEAVQLD